MVGFVREMERDADARNERAKLVEDCASKVGAWRTAHLPHDQALIVQAELVKASAHFRERALAIRAGTVAGVYD